MINVTRFNKTIQERFKESASKGFDLMELLEKVKNDSYGEIVNYDLTYTEGTEAYHKLHNHVATAYGCEYIEIVYEFHKHVKDLIESGENVEELEYILSSSDLNDIYNFENPVKICIDGTCYALTEINSKKIVPVNQTSNELEERGMIDWENLTLWYENLDGFLFCYSFRNEYELGEMEYNEEDETFWEGTWKILYSDVSITSILDSIDLKTLKELEKNINSPVGGYFEIVYVEETEMFYLLGQC